MNIVGVMLGDDLVRTIKVRGTRWKTVTVGKMHQCPICLAVVAGDRAVLGKHLERCQDVEEMLMEWQEKGPRNG